MTGARAEFDRLRAESQSAFVRGFIDDYYRTTDNGQTLYVSIRVRARLHR